MSSSSSSSSNSQTATAIIREEQVDLPTGVSMQVMSSLPDKPSNRPVLIFLHGSFHAAWCWAEHFFPFFVSKGYPVVAPSWRGTGGTFAGEGVRKVKIMEHVADLEAFMDKLPHILGRKKEETPFKPIIICHSFGGLALMKYLELNKAATLGGAVAACSVPPSGNGKMTLRFLRRSLSDSWKITAGFALKRCVEDSSLCRELFFGGDKQVGKDGTVVEDYGVSDEDIARYQRYFGRDSEATIDLVDLAKILPSKQVDADGKALNVASFPSCLVLGATDDCIVDQEGLDETAKYFGLEEPLIVNSPHDIMLGRNWCNAAEAIEKWLQETCPQ